jgi:hypothetical protein
MKMDAIIKQALDKMIEDLNILIEELNKNPLFEQIKQQKKLINDFSVRYGGGVIYSDIQSPEVKISSFNNIHPGQFKGMTLAKAIRVLLNMRSKENPPTFKEIIDALKKGDFEQGRSKDIRSTLLKNNQVCLLAGDHWGLVEWYGKTKKKNAKDYDKDEQEEEIEESDEQNETSDAEENDKGILNA